MLGEWNVVVKVSPGWILEMMVNVDIHQVLKVSSLVKHSQLE